MKKLLIYLLLASLILTSCQSISCGPADTDTSTGLLMIADSGELFILIENTPVLMRCSEELQETLLSFTTGDTINIVHTGIMESYPAQCEVLEFEALSRGDISKIPNEVLDSLADLRYTFGCEEKTQPESISFTMGDGKTGNAPLELKDGEKHVKVIRSSAELSAHYDSLPENDMIIYEPATKYDDSYFKESYLILVWVFGQSGMTRFTVRDVIKDGDMLNVNIESYTPALHTDDCYSQWLFIELSNNVDVFSDEYVTLNISTLEAFSYSYALEGLKDTGYTHKTEGFSNVKPVPVHSSDDALTLAQNELSDGYTYKSTRVAYDSFQKMWLVSFFEDVNNCEGFTGDCTNVYMTEDGKTTDIIIIK